MSYDQTLTTTFEGNFSDWFEERRNYDSKFCVSKFNGLNSLSHEGHRLSNFINMELIKRNSILEETNNKLYDEDDYYYFLMKLGFEELECVREYMIYSSFGNYDPLTENTCDRCGTHTNFFNKGNFGLCEECDELTEEENRNMGFGEEKPSLKKKLGLDE